MPSGTDSDTTLAPDLARDPLAPSHDEGEYDALADLFLGGPGDADPSAHPVGPPATPASAWPTIELLVSGHLPGASAPWPAQYAAAVAESLGAVVAMVRVGAGEISVDLLGDQVEPAVRVASLDAALAEASRAAARILVCVEDDQCPRVLEALAGEGLVTVLIGADEAATVDAYRRVKSIGESTPAGVGVSLAYMGADEIEARRAFDHLTRACQAFLDRPIARGPSVRRIGPVHRVGLSRGPFDADAGAVIDAIRALSEGAPPSEPVTRGPERPSPAVETPATSEPPARTLAESAPEPVEPAEPTELTEPTGPLVSRIAGLTPIESRCPYHPTVELAADGAGALALVASGGLERVGELLAVRSWASDHATLLAKAEPALGSATEPAMHIVTRSVEDARAIVAAGVRAHVLARAAADGWACVPMVG